MERRASQSSADRMRSHSSPKRLLVADDEEMVRMVICAILRRQGYEVDEAGDGEEAFHKVTEAAEPYALILLDRHMPKMGGDEVIAKILEQHPGQQALMLSGSLADHSGSLQGRPEVHFLQKPFANEELIGVVDRLTGTGSNPRKY